MGSQRGLELREQQLKEREARGRRNTADKFIGPVQGE